MKLGIARIETEDRVVDLAQRVAGIEVRVRDVLGLGNHGAPVGEDDAGIDDLEGLEAVEVAELTGRKRERAREGLLDDVRSLICQRRRRRQCACEKRLRWLRASTFEVSRISASSSRYRRRYRCHR